MRWDDYKKDDPVVGWDETRRMNENDEYKGIVNEDEEPGEVMVFGVIHDETKKKRHKEHKSANVPKTSCAAPCHAISATSHRPLHSSASGRKLNIWMITLIIAIVLIFGYAIMAFAGKLIAAVVVTIIFIYLFAIT